ncbi:sugar ABC transporter ATP-binding protein [Nakamurella flavida]|uniref:Sugar ABC transporter ATP-binding protein n=1 Tax=Nakamurella flavida TaxID=363630 RepID=A0A938YSR5_9ACTN|nr:sugar ABC transporter ATP-binding protein [Nakamurella flavida]MBM9478195.1 sugar ABC transporter ATP-binding protein [Nakamurella flavida]MDP9778583.1 ABC-type sugar transport system ATPase subunit [Nakamurella flavida]
MERGEVVLETRGLEKKYGENYALEPLDLTIAAGSIHGFLGKNGAGKSTLVGMIAGSVRPTAGEILHEGTDITSTGYTERRAMGIHLLGQHAELVGALSVAENLMMPNLPRGAGGLVKWSKVRSEAREVLERYRLPFHVSTPAAELSLHDQRRLAIARTLREGGSLAMLDEPTAALSRSERRELFDWIRELNAEGQTFVFISHYNSEIQEICDECTVFRDGRLVASGVNPRSISSAEISELVTGTAVQEFHRVPVPEAQAHLELRDFRAPGVGPIDLEIGRGQIIGFVGLPSSGAKELARAIGGLNPGHTGEIVLDGKAVATADVPAAHAAGIAYLTDDRIHEGLVKEISIMESLHLGNWPTSRGLVDFPAMKRYYTSINQRLHIRSSGQQQPVGELSGGNQQKVLIGAILALNPRVIILDEPTVGVDVGTKEEIHGLMDELTRQGISVILLTYDADEMCRVADIVVAFQDQRVARVLTGADITADAIIDSLVEHTGVSA